VATQMRTTHATRVVEVREGALDPLAALAHQSAPASAANPATIAVHRGLGLGRNPTDTPLAGIPLLAPPVKAVCASRY
jgi:hypothetical protein